MGRIDTENLKKNEMYIGKKKTEMCEYHQPKKLADKGNTANEKIQ